ncbi:MAG: hypothetical protein J6S13_01030 [Clostridia bacterium]|nr:hypothetical protein [Clostridia bacterium]
MSDYLKKTDRYGKIWIWTAAFIVLMVPVIISVKYNAWPPVMGVLEGLLGVAPIFWTVGVIEVITYTPMLGIGGTYLAFVTGNLTSLKAPSALTAMENAEVKSGTEEGEVISTIAIATSSIVTTLIIAAGVCVLSLIAPVLNSPELKPAFDNILPALFGGLGVVYISKNWKISIAPIVFMVALFLIVPSLAGSVGVLVPVGVIITLIAARIMYKKGII